MHDLKIGGTMKTSAPIHELKSKAKLLKKQHNLSLCKAQNQLARMEGYQNWPHLMSANSKTIETMKQVCDFFQPGDLILLAAIPKIHKTRIAGRFLKHFHQANEASFYFSLCETRTTVSKRLADIFNLEEVPTVSIFDEEDMNAERIIHLLSKDSHSLEGSFCVVDYLQLLDQKRSNPDLANQVRTLGQFAKEKQCYFLFLSQLNRNCQNSNKFPEWKDIRLPNPIDSSAFNKILFLHTVDSKKVLHSSRPRHFSIEYCEDF